MKRDGIVAYNWAIQQKKKKAKDFTLKYKWVAN